MEQHSGHITAVSTVVEALMTTWKEHLRDRETCSFGCSLAVSAKNAN